VNRGVFIHLIDHLLHLRLAGGGGKIDVKALDPRFLACDLFVSHIDGRGGIISDQNHSESRRMSELLRELLHATLQYLAALHRDLLTIDDLR